MRRERAPHGRWAIFVPLLAAILAGSLSMGAITPAVPGIAADLSLAGSSPVWVVDSYPLALAVSLVVAARLGDRFGRKRMLIVASSVATVVGVLTPTVDSLGPLVASRVVLGLAGGLALTSVVATVGVRFRGRDLAVANGAWVATVGAGNALGPFLGGAMAEAAGWRWIFPVIASVAATSAVTAVFLMPESRKPGHASFDLVGVLTSAAGLGFLVYGVKGLASRPLPALGWAVVGVFLLAWFVRGQWRRRDPLIDVSLLSTRNVAVSAGQVVISAAVTGAALYLVSTHVQDSGGAGPLRAGVLLIPLAVATTLSGVLGPILIPSLSLLTAARVALVVQGAGAVMTGGGLPLALGLAVCGVGYGLVSTCATTALFEAAGRERASQVGVVQEVAFAIGNGLGMATFGTLALAIGQGHGFSVALLVSGVVACGFAFIPPTRCSS